MAGVRVLGVTEPISTAAPTPLDLALSEELERELREAGLYEEQEEAVNREEVCWAHRLAPRLLSPALPGAGQTGRAGEALGEGGERGQGVHRAAAVRGAALRAPSWARSDSLRNR